MIIELKIDGQPTLTMQLDPKMLSRAFGPSTPTAGTVPHSTPGTSEQMAELLSRVDLKSAQFLRELAAHNGELSWSEMKRIFGIQHDSWSEYSASYGKGITRAYRHILNDKNAKLVWWDDSEWPVSYGDEEVSWDDCLVYVDEPALTALREAAKV